jgi:hypothetical protein
MASYFADTVAASGAVIEAAEPADFDRWVSVANDGDVDIRVGFTEEEVTSGYRIPFRGSVSLVLPAGLSLYIYNTNEGHSSFVIVSGTP